MAVHGDEIYYDSNSNSDNINEIYHDSNEQESPTTSVGDNDNEDNGEQINNRF